MQNGSGVDLGVKSTPIQSKKITEQDPYTTALGWQEFFHPHGSDAAVLPPIREMTKRTERFDPARDAVLSPRLSPVRKLTNETDELAIDKVKRLEAAKIGYAENIRNAHRPFG